MSKPTITDDSHIIISTTDRVCRRPSNKRVRTIQNKCAYMRELRNLSLSSILEKDKISLYALKERYDDLKNSKFERPTTDIDLTNVPKICTFQRYKPPVVNASPSKYEIKQMMCNLKSFDL